MSLAMKSRYIILGGLCLLALLLSGCGDDSDASVDSYEKALYMAYATTDSSEPMNYIAEGDLMVVISSLKTMIYSYYVNVDGNIEYSIDLSDPPTGWTDTPPSGMTGYIVFGVSGSNITVAADLDLSGCTIGSQTYTGTFKANATIVPEDFQNAATADFEDLTITVSNLKITYSNTDYEDVTFTNFVLGKDNSGSYAAYSFTGNLKYGNNGYGYDGFEVSQSSSSAKTVSGTLLFSGYYFGVSGSVTVNSSGNWTEGSLTITSQDSDGNVSETATVTLDGTTASFTIEGGDSWDMEDWYEDQLAP